VREISPDRSEPRFDLDLPYGKQAELQIGEFLDWIADGNGQVEVKHKRYLDHKLYVETHCDKGRTGTYRPSGISVTTAHCWVFVIGDTGVHVAIPTDLLRLMLTDPSSRYREERDGSCPTRGMLVDFCVLLWTLKRQSRIDQGRRLP